MEYKQKEDENYYRREAEPFRREVFVNGNVHSVALCSNDESETMDYLLKKALETLKMLKKE